MSMPLGSTPQPRRTGLTLFAALLLSTFGAPLTVLAQQQQLDTSSSTASPSNESATLTLPLSAAELPDAPSALQDPQSAQTSPPAPPQQTSTDPYAVSPNGTKQTKRVLGIVPNFSSVSADTKLPPQTAKEKFTLAVKNSFDYSSFIIAGVQAGISMNGNSYPEFHQGAAGYARYYWHTLADTADENFMVGGVGPIVFHQDNRFYTLGHGGFRKRTWYAVTRVLVSRTDEGNSTFNFSEIVGSGAAAGASTLYYPTVYRTWTKVGQKWLTSDLIDCFNFFWKEYWPDVNKRVFHTQ
ncbi:MAG TPA: hypothetical protein VH117_09475 [Edaphobacter sp.]|jgi:hypothetical protein|nr:hypothetical protein [Edaphobacter sp.]